MPTLALSLSHAVSEKEAAEHRRDQRNHGYSLGNSCGDLDAYYGDHHHQATENEYAHQLRSHGSLQNLGGMPTRVR